MNKKVTFFNTQEAEMQKTKPKPKVRLTGTSGNAFAILGKVRKALVRAGMKAEAKAFMEEAMSGDYDHLLVTASQYVDVS